MISVWLSGLGVYAPGMIGWPECAQVLAGNKPYVAGELPNPKPTILGADLRRRTSLHIRLAVAVAAEAVEHARIDATQVPAVFASSECDGETTQDICEAVVQAEPAVSPTRFHNSVNNAAAAYWSIGTGSRRPTTSVLAYDGCVAAGLLEGAALATIEGGPVLIVVHDTPAPQPLHGLRPLPAAFGVAMVINASRCEHGLCRLDLAAPVAGLRPAVMADRGLEALRRGNPAAAVLPLVEQVACRRDGEIVLPYPDGQGVRVIVAAAGA